MNIDRMDLYLKSQEIRKKLGEDTESPVDIFTLSLSIKRLTLVMYPMSCHLSGMCIKTCGGNIIAINSTMTLGRQRFSLAHELYHLFYDESMSAICSANIGVGNETERKADQFASYFIIPATSLKRKICELKSGNTNRKLTINDIVRLEQFYGVSRQAMLIRLIADSELSRDDANAMKQNVIYSAHRLGYSSDLYKPNDKDKQYAVYGYLIEQATKAHDADLISDGKLEEILLQAFRADLVYGEDEGGEVID
jgi:Zn-dependent peptidase ImmA (M78 family)